MAECKSCKCPDGYGKEEIQKNIYTKWAGGKLLFFEETDSTNIMAKRKAAEGAAHGALIVADMQTAGKGRRGRSWNSPAGVNVYFSIILRPEFATKKASMLTLVMAYAVARGLEKTLRETISVRQAMSGRSKESDSLQKASAASCLSGIKWPNDLVVHGKKICGILTEMGMEQGQMQYVIIGCGINVGKQEFAPHLTDKATSLEAETGRSISRAKLIGNIMEAFEEEYEAFAAQGSLRRMLEAYNAMLVNLNRQVCVLDPAGEYRGIARGISETGELLVELPDGSVKEVYAGEVSVRGIYGYVD